MHLLRLPGVYRPQADTDLLAEALRLAVLPPGAHVLDAGCGTGALSVAAAEAGASTVTAIDLSALAAMCTFVNTGLHGLPVTVRRGDALAELVDREYDVILANPPYVPSPRPPSPDQTGGRSWDAGPDGRAVLDPLCERAPEALRRGGFLLVVHSDMCGIEQTLGKLRASGLKAGVVARRSIPFGPILRSRTPFLERHGLIERGQRHEELVVIRGDRTSLTT